MHVGLSSGIHVASHNQLISFRVLFFSFLFFWDQKRFSVMYRTKLYNLEKLLSYHIFSVVLCNMNIRFNNRLKTMQMSLQKGPRHLLN